MGSRGINAEYIGAANVTHLLPYLIEMFIATYGRTTHLYILECSTVQFSPAVEEEEESSRPSVEWEVPRELLLHRDHLMPPLVIGFERFEENIWKIFSSNTNIPPLVTIL